MANSIPMWWMCSNPSHPQRKPVSPCTPPDLPPPPEPNAPSPQKEPSFQRTIAALTERFRRTDSETLLLLALLWLLWQEHADRKLLLALAYIIW